MYKRKRMKVISKTNYHNKSQISFAHIPVKNTPQYVKSVTEKRIFPELYRYKYYNYFTTYNKTDFVKKNMLTAGYNKYVEQEKNELVKKFKEYHYV